MDGMRLFLIPVIVLVLIGGIAPVAAVDTNAGERDIPFQTWSGGGSGWPIVVYADDINADPPYIVQALESLGYAYHCFYGENADEEIMMKIESSSSVRHLFISHCTKYNLAPGMYINVAYKSQREFDHEGGNCILASFDVDPSYPVREWDAFLPDRLGVQQVADPGSAQTIYGWDAELWKGVPPLTNPTGQYIDTGDRLFLSDMGIAAGGYTATAQQGEVAIIRGTTICGNRIIINCFIPDNYDGDNDHDGIPDAVELWKNEIQWVMTGEVPTPVDEFPSMGIPLLITCGFLAVVVVLTQRSGPK